MKMRIEKDFTAVHKQWVEEEGEVAKLPVADH